MYMPKNRTRVCHIGFNYFPGQGLTIFYEFARHQAMMGLEVSVIAPGRSGEALYEIIEGVHVHRIPTESVGRFSFGRLAFLIKATNWLRKQKFDLVHVYAFVGASVLPWLGGRTRSVWLYDCQTSAIKPPLLALQNFLIRFESWSYDVTTVLSEGIRDMVFGPNAQVTAIVPLGADFTRFKPQTADERLRTQYGILQEVPILTYCGTLDHNRHIDKLLYSFAYAAEQLNTVVLLVIGEGAALDDLKQQARALNLTNRIVFTGYVPYREIPAHMSITTIALAYIAITPYFQHQPPTKTVEYLACGLPVIATDTMGNRLFVRDGINGLLRSDDVEIFGNAIVELVQNTAQRAKLAERARESASDFHWEKIIRQKVLLVYDDAISRYKKKLLRISKTS
jgi:glycosyltransferase involved in cell wall biosynthesis